MTNWKLIKGRENCVFVGIDIINKLVFLVLSKESILGYFWKIFFLQFNGIWTFELILALTTTIEQVIVEQNLVNVCYKHYKEDKWTRHY